MAKCNRDCFNCIHDDCIIEKITSEERKEIRNRDDSFFNTTTLKTAKEKLRAKRRYSR